MRYENERYINNYINLNYFYVDELKNEKYKSFIVKGIVKRLSNSDLSFGKYDFFIDSEIEKNMKSAKSKTYKELIGVKEHVFLVMNYCKTFENAQISLFNKTQLLITKSLITKYEIEDILNGNYDSEIKKEIYLREKMLTEEDKIRIYVRKYTKKIDTHIEENIQCVDIITKELIDSGYNIEQVKEGICSPIIKKYIMKTSIKENSVMSKNDKFNLIPLKVKKNSNPLKTKIAISILCLTIIGSIFTSQETYEKPTLQITDVIDNYEYLAINDENSNEFCNAYMNVMDKYSEYEKYGHGYGQICLFKVYESIEDEPFHYMDVLFGIVKQFSKYDEELEAFTNDISSYSCYPQYIFDQLGEANVNEIYDNDIIKALNEYNRQVYNYKGIVPYTLLDKKEQKSLQKLMEIYEEYIRELENNLTEVINGNVGKEK